MRAIPLRRLAVAAAAVALLACGARQKKDDDSPHDSELGRRAPSELGSRAPSEVGNAPADGGPSMAENHSAGTHAVHAHHARRTSDSSTGPRAHAGPKIIPAAALESLRTRGNRTVRPPHSVQAKLRQSKRDRIVVLMKMCVSKKGIPIRLETIRPSHFPRYDHRIFNAMRKWRFRPFEIDGKPVEVCTMVTFLYEQ